MHTFFSNNNKRNIDKYICNFYSKNYFKFLIITNIYKIKNLKIERKILYLILLNHNNLLINKYNYKSYHRDISFLSGRNKSLIIKYGIARTDFKMLMIKHQIPNLQKASW